ncbi:FxSxx-COOH system tetratricopeptide repeat protein [Streptomyces sp. JNUCC 64]
MADGDRDGRIVTFYSYKGGTGRTMALANTAWILASNGLRVLMVDGDLEAPGLHRYVHPFLPPSTLSSTSGLVDLLTDYVAVAREGERPRTELIRWHARTRPHAVSLDWAFPGGGSLDFVSAGLQDQDYVTDLLSFDWPEFTHRFDGLAFVEALRADMARHYDYALIDSRSGIGHVVALCTMELPDVLVNCFTPADQSLAGAVQMTRYIDRHSVRDLRILPVPTRVEVEHGWADRLEAARALTRSSFEGFPRGLTPAGADAYWAAVEIPYRPAYAYEETLAVFRDPTGQPQGLLASFERLTSVITEGRVRRLPPLDEQVRRRTLEAFVRRRPPAPAPVVLAHVPQDRMWADWVGWVLRRAGFRVLSLADAAADPATAAPGVTPRTLALLSTSFLRAPQSRTLHEAVGAPRPDGPGPASALIPLRIEQVPPSPPFSHHESVDLTVLDEDAAREALLRALGSEEPPAPDREGREEREAPPPRFPRHEPAVWHVPPRHALFVGRDRVLDALHDALRVSGTVVLLPGTDRPGAGRTQLAVEYCHRFRADYDLVWWVPAASRELAAAALALLAERLGLPCGDGPEAAAARAREALDGDPAIGRWLLVLDDAHEPDGLADLLPDGSAPGPGHLLVRPRPASGEQPEPWSGHHERLVVGAFGRDESVELLRRSAPGLWFEDADRIAELAGDRPLEVTQAAAWLSRTEGARDGPLGEAYVRGLPERPDRITAFAVEHLARHSPAALRLLLVCAVMARRPVPHRVVYGDGVLEVLRAYDPTLREPLLLGRVVRELSRLGLAEVDRTARSLRIPPAVRSTLVDLHPDEVLATARREARRALIAAAPRPDDDADAGPGGRLPSDEWCGFEDLWTHLLATGAATAPSTGAADTDDEVRAALVEGVRRIARQGAPGRALELGRAFDVHWSEHLARTPARGSRPATTARTGTGTVAGDARSPEDPGTPGNPEDTEAAVVERRILLLRARLAAVLRTLGRPRDAHSLDAATLERQRLLLPAGHPHLLATLCGLAEDLRALGGFPAALRADEEASAGFAESLGEEHPRSLAAADALALSLRLTGDGAAAARRNRAALTHRTALLGPAHPATLRAALALGRDLRDAGDFRGSAQTLRAALDASGDGTSPDVPRMMMGLAMSLWHTGEFRTAAELAKAARGRYAPCPPDADPAALACDLALTALLAGADGNPRETRDRTRELLERFARSRGDRHPETLGCAHNLVVRLRATEDFKEAAGLAATTVRELASAVGPGHPLSLCARVTHANTRADLGKLGQARELGRELVEELSQTAGPSHPDTVAGTVNLAVTLRDLDGGPTAEAERLRDRALAESTRRWGAGHPWSRAAAGWLRIDRDLEPQLPT